MEKGNEQAQPGIDAGDTAVTDPPAAQVGGGPSTVANQEGPSVTEQHPDGTTSVTRTDGRGRVTETVDADGDPVDYDSYDPDLDHAKVTRADGSWTSLSERDGTTIRAEGKADGSYRRVRTWPDGSTVVDTHGADGNFHRERYNADGSVME